MHLQLPGPMHNRWALGALALVGAGAAVATVAVLRRDEAAPRTPDSGPGAGSTPGPWDRPPVDCTREPLPAAHEPGTHPLRVMSLNVHRLVPKGVDRYNVNESRDALLDTAAWINEVNPDVVMLQEVENDSRPDGLGDQLAQLSELVGATDARMAARTGRASAQIDNALITRNGVEIRTAGNIELKPGGAQNRSTGIATIHTPAGADATVLFTHLNPGVEGRETRHEHLLYLATLVHDLRTHGVTTFQSRDTREAARFEGDVDDPIIIAGDFNAHADEIDPLLACTGLVNADAASEGARRPGFGIDNIYATEGVRVLDTHKATVPALHVQGHPVTDHPSVIADLLI